MKTNSLLSIRGFSARRSVLLALTIALVPLVSAFGVNFYDDFENGVGGDIVYSPWGNVSGDPTSPNGINNLVTTASNEHSVSGIRSARVFASDPAAWNGFADFGATSGALRASVWLFEDKNNTANDVTCMLSLYGDSGTQNPNEFTDYLQLGVVPFYPAGSQGYGWRTASGGIQNAAPAVSRKAGWTELAIEAESLADGGQVRFYIDNELVGTSVRAAGVDLRWVRIGNNSKSYENFWYDDLRVSEIPEPTTMALLGLGGFALAALGRRRLSR